MACSSGEATVSAMVLGLAPGYVARTTIVGGTTSGYSLIGSCQTASSPSRKITLESTPAKIGRRMKKFEKFMLGFNWLSSLLALETVRGASVREGRQAFCSSIARHLRFGRY